MSSRTGSGDALRRALARPAGDDGASIGILALQRARLLSAAVGVIAEHGYRGASVAMLSERAGVSRRTFYEIFENREECMLALLSETEARVACEIERVGVDGGSWRERVRCGLWALLCFADREPPLARVCLIESQHGGPLVQAERERILMRLAEIVDEGRSESARAAALGPLTAEASVGAIATVLQARLLPIPDGLEDGEAPSSVQPPLRELLGELMGLIALPYLGVGVAQRERTRPLPGDTVAMQRQGAAAAGAQDPLAGLPVRLTYRTVRVLQAAGELAEQGAPASNRQVAERAGVRDIGQISKLLARLQQHGLLVNTATAGNGKGQPNKWALSDAGWYLLQSLRVGTEIHQQSKAA
ncbi:MAG TPA: TetR/AcrR family transcriptional regulator [Solirubrobacteraceae bacterium]|jgi:AcrR family transcriptional regulator